MMSYLEYLNVKDQDLSSREKYEKIEVIGQGSFGVVYLAKDKESKELVAIKKIKMGSDSKNGVNASAIREMKILREVKHENIIDLKDVFFHSYNLNLVFERMDTDLEEIIKNKMYLLTESDIKCFMYQILQGISKLHSLWILHRDIKPSNILVTSQKPIKLTDFGLSKVLGNNKIEYSPQCVTRWYRAPELLYGAKKYGFGVDMWSVGCVFAELMLRNPLFPGISDIDQLGKIFAALGTPTTKDWPLMKSLPNYIQFGDFPSTPFNQIFTAASKEAIDLISKFLVFDPKKRISAKDALEHDYFKKGAKFKKIFSFQLQKKSSKRDNRFNNLLNEEEEDGLSGLLGENETTTKKDGVSRKLIF